MKKPIRFSIALIVISVISYAVSSHNKRLDAIPQEAQLKNQPAGNESYAERKQDYFFARTSLRGGRIDAEFLAILEAFESKDEELVRRLFSEWFARDEAGALEAFHKTEGFFSTFGIDPPYDLMASLLFEKYPGSEIMEIVGRLPGLSMSTDLMVAELFKLWEDSDDKDLFEWIRENQTFNNAHALLELVEHQLEIGKAEEYKIQIGNYLTLENTDIRKEMMVSTFLDSWIVSDLEAASNYLNSLSKEEYSNSFISQSVQNVAFQAAEIDPAVAMEWASDISDDGTRAITEAVVATKWIQNDKNSFENWFQSRNFTEEEERNFLQTVEYLFRQDSISDDTEARRESLSEFAHD